MYPQSAGGATAQVVAERLSTCVRSRFWPALRLESNCLDKPEFRRELTTASHVLAPRDINHTGVRPNLEAKISRECRCRHANSRVFQGSA